MAAKEGESGGGGGGERQLRPPAPPLRPTLVVPPRTSVEGLFGHMASPGPLTLAASLFPDEQDSDFRSFTQLLVGAMSPPGAAPRRPPPAPALQGEQEETAKRDSGGGEGGGRPAGLAVPAPSPAQLFTIPPGLSPAGLLDSPGFFSPGMANFGISHQQALAQVTAHATQTQLNIFTTDPVHSAPQSNEPNLTEQIQQISPPLIVDKPADDGYNWRKYGQKMVKGSKYPRSYYKCTHSNCSVKKKVERSAEGQITEIIYKGQHNHPKPTSRRVGRDGRIEPGEIDGSDGRDGLVGPNDGSVGPSKREREVSGGLNGDGSSESESEEAEAGDDEVDDDSKIRNSASSSATSSSQRTLAEPRIIVQTTSEVDLLDDGYRWRKYGQKVVKGNPNPRSYYKCTYSGCNVKKHIERSSQDPKAVITTYEGKHNHDVPAGRNATQSSSNLQKNRGQISVLQLKEEHEIT